MRRLISPLLAVFTVALLIEVLVQTREVHNLQLQTAELTQQLFKSEQQSQHQAAQIVSSQKNLEILKAESQALRERRQAAAATAEATPSPSPSASPADSKPGFPGMLKKMMADPQMRKTMVQQQMAALRKYYTDFAKQARLDPQQTEKLFDLLAKRQEAMMELGMNGSTPGAQPAKNYKDDFKALLGEQGAAQFQEFEKSLPDRLAMTQLNQQLASNGVELNDSQSNSLLKIMAEERSKMPAPPFKGTDGMNVSNEEMDRYYQQVADYNEMVRNRARSFLTDAQIEQMRLQQIQALELQKMGIKMAKAMLGK